MFECIIAMSTGIILGVSLTIITTSVMLNEVYGRVNPTEKKPTKAEAVRINAERESISKQLENFLNYSGSADGQKTIGDDFNA